MSGFPVLHREAWHVAVHGLKRVRQNWVTEQPPPPPQQRKLGAKSSFCHGFCHVRGQKSEQLPSELGGIKEKKKKVQACSLFSLYSLFSGNEERKTHSAFFLFTATLSVNIQDWFPLELTGLISLHSKGLSRVFSITAVRNHQFFGTQHFLLSVSLTCTWLLEKP